MIPDKLVDDCSGPPEYRMSLATEVDLAGWRDKARALLHNGVAPHQVHWMVEGRSCTGRLDLSAQISAPAMNLDRPARDIRIARDLLSLIKGSLLHRNEDRFDLAYRVLHRAQTVPGLHRNPADADIIRLHRYAKAVRRDMHKMHAFVRFRKIGECAGREQFVSWFEPDHHIVQAVAPFFRNRFTCMDWLILTPRASIGWDGKTLSTGPGGCKNDVQQEDLVEEEWRTYYANIFNPARVKTGAMKSEMPVKYWKNLPEADLIPSLLEQSGSRVDAMVSQAGDMLLTGKGAGAVQIDPPRSLAELYRMLEGQGDAPAEKFSDKLVCGTGPANAGIMLIGEQPGDREDRLGKPFVGPAGQLLDRALEQVGIDRQAIFLTNAVKRFKFTVRGKRRIHETPSAGEIDYYRWWVEQEIRLVNPRLVVAMGASAARCLLGRPVRISRHRGEILPGTAGRSALITVHPSYLLRIPDEQGRAVELARFVRDMQAAAAFVA